MIEKNGKLELTGSDIHTLRTQATILINNLTDETGRKLSEQMPREAAWFRAMQIMLKSQGYVIFKQDGNTYREIR